MRRRAVFLDRDGTLNRERGPVCSPAELEVLPGARDAVARLDSAGWPVVVVTNQSGVARGLYDEATVARVHAALHDALDRRPRGYFHCPHLPEGRASTGYACDCPCRKPKDGLLRQAAATLDLELAGSFLVGDSARDLLPGKAHGMRAILVRSGKPWEVELAKLTAAGAIPEAVVDDLAAAADLVLRGGGPGTR
ncbi:MAG TPA: HAD family hydrolase [Planctomycetota bacterium]|nr:HAD family hydrolase [Planctomycetota bacterium]